MTRKREQKDYIPKVNRDTESAKDPAFIKLQNKWYKKLKKQGFEDLEWVDDGKGIGQDSSFLLKPLTNMTKFYKKDVENFYRICRNYAGYGTFASKLDKYCFKYYADGQSYRQIQKIIAKKHKITLTHVTVFNRIKKIIPTMMRWNNDPTNKERTILTEDDYDHNPNHLFRLKG